MTTTLKTRLDELREAMGDFFPWSPLQLAHVTGHRIDLRTRKDGSREPWLIAPDGTATPTGHEDACEHLATVARFLGVDPRYAPTAPRRALVDGAEQDA